MSPLLASSVAARPRQGAWRNLGRRWQAALGASLHEQRWIVAIMLVTIAAGLIMGLIIKAASGAATLYFPVYIRLMPTMLVALLAGRLLYIALIVRPARPLMTFFDDLWNRILTVERISMVLPILVLMPFFCNAFTILKSSITLIQPFAWDVRFEAVDRALHGNIAPWELLHPILGVPVVTQTLDFVYVTWFFVLSFTWVWQAFAAHDRTLRLQFFASLLLVWVIFGVLVATIFSSAGPCYFSQVTGLPSPFTDLFAYLQASRADPPLWALHFQDNLWANYSVAGFGLGSGISAMPSMHVAIAMLMALLAWRTHWILGVLGSTYLVAIQLGSVHLGWHYAIDGYLGMAGALSVWFSVGWIMERRTAASAAHSKPIENTGAIVA